jgi:hypothetical protein
MLDRALARFVDESCAHALCMIDVLAEDDGLREGIGAVEVLQDAPPLFARFNQIDG